LRSGARVVNSSDWIAALSGPLPGDDEEAKPVWLLARSGPEEFSPVSPFARALPHAVPDPGPAPEPLPASPPGEPEADAAELPFEEGYAQGRNAALAEARAEADREMRHLRDLRLAFRTLDGAAIEALAGDLHATVRALCAQVIEDCARDPDALAKRCRRAAARIAQAPGSFAFHLHPLDIAAVGEDAFAGLPVKSDAAVERGGLRLVGPDCELRDGPEEWRAAIAAALQSDSLPDGA